MEAGRPSAAKEAEGGILPAVARAAIEEKLVGRPFPEIAVTGYLAQQRGVFVTIWQGEGERELRGCKGTIRPVRPNLLEETRYNALSAAFEDWRCRSVTGEELEVVRMDVSVLGELEPVEGEAELDPGVYGVVVAAADGRRGLLLPQVRGIETVREQVSTACRKAGIEEGERFEMMRFRIEKFIEGT